MNEKQTYQDDIDYDQTTPEYTADDVLDHSSDYLSEESYEEEKEKRPRSFWIASLKLLSSLVFVVVLLIGLVRGIGVFLSGNQLAGLLIFLGISLSSFMILALVMVFIHLAEDSMRTRHAIEIIKDKKRW
jgi:hypothetical protein